MNAEKLRHDVIASTMKDNVELSGMIMLSIVREGEGSNVGVSSTIPNHDTKELMTNIAKSMTVECRVSGCTKTTRHPVCRTHFEMGFAAVLIFGILVALVTMGLMNGGLL